MKKKKWKILLIKIYQNLNSDEKSISFYDEFMIVNDNFIKVLKFNILLDSLIVNPVKCLIDSKYIYLLYSLNEHCLINVGEFGSSSSFSLSHLT